MRSLIIAKGNILEECVSLVIIDHGKNMQRNTGRKIGREYKNYIENGEQKIKIAFEGKIENANESQSWLNIAVCIEKKIGIKYAKTSRDGGAIILNISENGNAGEQKKNAQK